MTVRKLRTGVCSDVPSYVEGRGFHGNNANPGMDRSEQANILNVLRYMLTNAVSMEKISVYEKVRIFEENNQIFGYPPNPHQVNLRL